MQSARAGRYLWYKPRLVTICNVISVCATTFAAEMSDCQHVRHRAALEINDGSVGEAFAPAPVVDRDGAQRFGLAMLMEMALLPKDRAVANGYPKHARNLSLTLPQAAWPNSRTSSPTRRVFRANGSTIASFSANVFRAHCSLRHFQRPERSSSVAGRPWIGILKTSHMPAVSQPGSLPTAGTRSRSLALGGYDRTPLTERRPSHDNPGPEGQFRCFHHPPDMTKPPTRGNRARKVNQTQLLAIRRPSAPLRGSIEVRTLVFFSTDS
jgi:hypothetical protein